MPKGGASPYKTCLVPQGGWWKVACTQGDSQQGFFQDARSAEIDSSEEKRRERYTSTSSRGIWETLFKTSEI